MHRRQLLLGLGSAFVAAACGTSPTQPGPTPQPPPEPQPPPPPPPRLGITRILAFGDSLTAGTTSAPLPGVHALDAGLPQSYVFKLQTLLTQRYSAQTVQVFNEGRAGNRAAQDQSRLIDAIRASNPEALLLLEGANDLNQVGTRDAIAPTIGALEVLIGEGVSRGVRVFIGTLPPQRPGGKSAAAGFITDFNDQLRRMAPDEGATLVDLFRSMSLSDIGEDGLHPTEAGYQHMAEVWLEALKAAYEQPPQSLLSDRIR
jgi:lysophospholipase L1-like esterase